MMVRSVPSYASVRAFARNLLVVALASVGLVATTGCAPGLTAKYDVGDAVKARDPAAIATLVKALDDESASVRAEAATALAKYGATAREAVPTLAARLNDNDFSPRTNNTVAVAAVRALGAIGNDAASAVPAILPLLTRADTAKDAAAALRNIGVTSRPVLQALAEAETYWKQRPPQKYENYREEAVAARDALRGLVTDASVGAYAKGD